MIAVQSKGAPLAGGGRDAHHTTSRKLPHLGKKGLRSASVPVYGYSAPAKSGAGISLPDMIEATHDAPSVFFCVVNSVHPFFSDAVIIRAAIKIMVGCVGASSEAPGSLITGKANLAQFTTRQISLCGGGYIPLIKEAAKWLLPLPKLRNLSGLSPQFAAICRQFLHKSTISPRRQSVKHAAHWRGITSAFSQVASVWRWLMLKTYDLPYDPLERINHLIAIIDLMADIVGTESDSRDDYLAALTEMLSVATRDLYSTLQCNQLPEGGYEPVNSVS